ncbi:MAG: hypothetical protein ACTSVZ_06375 [Promethearchaeota archaeon]
MFLQPPPAAPSPWDIGNYPWSSAFIWIAAAAGLVFGLLLFASYASNHKKQLLLWSFGFFGVWIFYHQMITVGTYDMLVFWDDTSMFGIPTEMLTLLIPGFFAAGVCFAKSEQFGKIFSWYIAFMTVVYTVLQTDPSNGQIANTDLYAAIVAMLVTIPSGLLIILLPVMDEGNLMPRTLMGLGGILQLTMNLFFAIIFFFAPLAVATIDWIFMIMPFFIVGTVLFLIFGMIGKEEYGFKLPYLKFEGEE